jgi:dsRNA-specific ribonuclease
MNIETVKQAIGILNFKKTELLEIALTHPSYIYENNNLNQLQKDQQKREYRRLALLGDSILGTVVIEYLYDRLPAENQGTLTNWKSDLVRRNKAYEFARKLNLRRLCMLGQGEKTKDESEQIQLFGEMFEALLGAIYLEFERDFSRARNWLVNHFIEDAVDDLLTDTPITDEQLPADNVQAVSLMNSDEAADQLSSGGDKRPIMPAVSGLELLTPVDKMCAYCE